MTDPVADPQAYAEGPAPSPHITDGLLATLQQVIQDQQLRMNQQDSALQGLASALSSLQIEQTGSDSLNNSFNRAPPQSPQRGSTRNVPVLGKEHIAVIPEFNGSHESLHEFLSITGKLHARFYNQTDPDDFQNVMLLAGIKSKIRPPASTVLAAANLVTYDSLRQALLNAYSDKRDILSMNIDLCKLRHGEHEDPFKFHLRVHNALLKIVAYLQTHCPVPQDPAGIIKHYEDLALRVFLLHVRDPIGSTLRTRQPKDLNDALNIMTNEINVRRDPNPKPSNTSFKQPNQIKLVPRAGPTTPPWQPRPPSNAPPGTQQRPPNNQAAPPARPQPNPPLSQPNPFSRPVSRQIPAPQRFTRNDTAPSRPPNKWQPMSWQTTNSNFLNYNADTGCDPPQDVTYGDHDPAPYDPYTTYDPYGPTPAAEPATGDPNLGGEGDGQTTHLSEESQTDTSAEAPFLGLPHNTPSPT